MEEETSSKLSSRKFIVWIVWLAITLIFSVAFVIYTIVTKSIPDNIVDFMKLVLQYFFVISCCYLGVNLIGKGIYAVKDIFTSEEENVAESK